MDPKSLVAELKSTKQYFDRSIECLTEDDSTFSPVQGMMTAAQQVAHVAHTVDWFLEGAFRPEGFDLDFEKHATEVAGVSSLADARRWLDRAFGEAERALAERTPDELTAPLPEGPVMGGEPRLAIVGAIVDHTAHHRGALTVYSRLRGHVPAMPYM